MYKYYQNKCVVMSPSEQRKAWGQPRDKHATISVITHTQNDFTSVDEYLLDCEQQFDVGYIRRMQEPAEQAWHNVMSILNAQFNKRGKNVVLECLQFGGNREFWNGFPDEDEIYMYFRNCYTFAVDKIGYLHTDKNIICAVIITEPNRRNLFVYYLPITERWQVKVMRTTEVNLGTNYRLATNSVMRYMKISLI